MIQTFFSGKRSVLDKDDDADSQPNTYDYNDSFIDDAGASDSSESYADPADEDSDWEAEGSQDIRDLKKEAKAFKKNKKLVKPARNK